MIIRNTSKKVALVTGSAGFIGFHVCKRLLESNWRVIGVDCISDYYDINLKYCREDMLFKFPNYKSVHGRIEQPNMLMELFGEENPSVVIHLAAQAGVRHSIENPRSYLESNVIGTFELLEAARAFPPEHLLLASTSSAYGASQQMPYCETDKADHQMSFYAATKKSTENFAHSYSHLFGIPTTMFRFFTVYGPWGRPDMALFKFTKAILENKKIDIFNNGEMKRDFTFIDDLVTGLVSLINYSPNIVSRGNLELEKIDSLSPVAPFRVVNIGNATSIALEDFIEAIENCLGRKAQRNFLPMQPGDVPETIANNNLLVQLTGTKPKTGIQEGIKAFVHWYKEFYNIE